MKSDSNAYEFWYNVTVIVHLQHLAEEVTLVHKMWAKSSLNLCIYLEQKTTNQANFCTTWKQEQQFPYRCCITNQVKLFQIEEQNETLVLCV